MHLNKVEKEDHLFAAFSYFDKDGSGYITQDELQQACEEFGIDNTQLDEMIKEADQNNVSASVINLSCTIPFHIIKLLFIVNLRLTYPSY